MVRGARNGVSCGIQDAELTSTTLLAVSVLLTVPQVRLILEYHVLKRPTEEALARSQPARLALNKMGYCAILNAAMDSLEMARYAGAHVQLAKLNVLLSAPIQNRNALTRILQLYKLPLNLLSR